MMLAPAIYRFHRTEIVKNKHLDNKRTRIFKTLSFFGAPEREKLGQFKNVFEGTMRFFERLLG